MSDALPNAKATFDRAHKLIGGDRRESYGPPQASFDRIAQVWTGILGDRVVTAREVCLLMTGLKLCREANSAKQDNVDDACGYLGLLAELKGEPQPDQSAFSKHCADMDARLREESRKLRESLILRKAQAAQNASSVYHDCSTPPPTAL